MSQPSSAQKTPIRILNPAMHSQAKMPARFIVKVQTPLMTNDPEPKALVYDEKRWVEDQFPITKALKDAMGDSHKRYFWAHMEGTELHLDERAGAQPW